MSHHTPIYGHSRGYRTLALLAVAAIVVSFLDIERGVGMSSVGIVGLIGFSALFFYAWRRAARRVVVMNIQEGGFSIDDPAQPFGLIEFDEFVSILQTQLEGGRFRAGSRLSGVVGWGVPSKSRLVRYFAG